MPKYLRILVPYLVLLVIVAAAATLGQYLGGMLFARMQKLPQDSVGVFTLFDYWQAYGDVPAVKRALSVCTLLSAVIGSMPAVVITMALLKTRGRIAQFGNARFATRRDIVKAGLLEK
jgi:type IV secretory pathway TraG/TraD family ATPase VirD4